MDNKENNILLIGDGGVGKTTYIKRITSGEFIRKYIATQNCDIDKNMTKFYEFGTNFNLIDTAGQEKYGSPVTPLYIFVNSPGV